MEHSDELLVVQVQSELPYDTRAFERLASQRYSKVRQLARGIVGSWDDADTVAQDVMLRVFHGIQNLRDVATFDGWLRRIVVNTARSFLAKERSEREKAQRAYAQTVDSDEWLVTPIESSVISPDQKFADLIAPLSLEERTLLTFRFVDEMEFSDIAAVMEMKLSATKMRFYRALEKLNPEPSGAS